MNILLSLIALVLCFLAFRFLIFFSQNYVRKNATKLSKGQNSLKEVDFLSVKVMSNTSIAGGPVAGRIIQTVGRMVLCETQLLFATNHGRILVMNDEFRGEARAVGPRRLVLLGLHPTGRADVRLEIIIDDEAAWAEEINRRFAKT